jgi:hypothetical protein
MKVGITGTRKGLSYLQTLALKVFIRDNQIEEFHHGDCKGVDVEACALIRSLSPETSIHSYPCSLVAQRGYFNSDIERKPAHPITRNHHIVDAVDLMLIFPSSRIEQLRSGTWATYRFTKFRKRPYRMVFPDGVVELG